MSVLKNPRHERYCQERAKGLTQAEAYSVVGYRPSDANASTLEKRDDVRARIDEIVGKAAEKAGVTVERIIGELAGIAFANAGDYFEWGPGGVTIKSSDTLTKAQRAVISEVCETRTETGGSIKIKLSEKQSALEKLGKHLGMFKEKIEHTGKDGGPIQLTPTIILNGKSS